MKIPFNLHAAIDGKLVINGKGEDCEFIAYYPGETHPVFCIIRGVEDYYKNNGEHRVGFSESRNLYMKPEKITRWILVNSVVGFDTKEKAFNFYKNHTENDSSLIKVEFYPGEGLE